MVTLLLLLSGDVHQNPGPNTDKKCIEICHVNMRSLKPQTSTKLDELHSTVCIDKTFDIICISETWLDNTIMDSDIDLPDYKIFRKDRNRHGGGVAIYVHDSLPVRKLNEFDINGLELVCVELIHNNKKFIIACCYRPPGANLEESTEFLENFQTVYNLMLTFSPESVFILGDFNDRCLQWEDPHKNSELGLTFFECLQNNLLFQIIKEPTYICDKYNSILDLIITDSPGYILDSGVGNPIGDPSHCLIFCKVQIQYIKDAKYEREIWKYDDGDFDTLNNMLSTSPWQVMYIYDDFNDMAEYFTSLYLNACKQYVPNKKISINPKDKPWMNKFVKAKLKDRDKWHNRLKSLNNVRNLELYKVK